MRISPDEPYTTGEKPMPSSESHGTRLSNTAPIVLKTKRFAVRMMEWNGLSSPAARSSGTMKELQSALGNIPIR